ncbi:MAG: hypothetical protein LBJ59_09415 [Zoogloeaceae bacterium]|jgi:hypothetical protein|nr:hypothetical protein [Zoogloeaceae bacterium]
MRLSATIDDKPHGSGCGWMDMSLPASTRRTPGARLQTQDKRLKALAERFKAAFS